MLTTLRRDILLGAIAGLIGGLLFALALQNQGMMLDKVGLLGVRAAGAGFGGCLSSVADSRRFLNNARQT